MFFFLSSFAWLKFEIILVYLTVGYVHPQSETSSFPFKPTSFCLHGLGQ